jgi:hypothetical protein
MSRRGPDPDRLASVPRRPHRLAVIVPILLIMAAVALAYRHAGERWPGSASGHGRVDVSETDAAHHPNPALPGTRARSRVGAPSAGGFHHP